MRKKSIALYVNVLYGLAGYLNALTILMFTTMTGVQTGNISNIIIGLFGDNIDLSAKLLTYVLTFILGSIIVGFFTKHKVQFWVRMTQFSVIHMITALFLFFSYNLNFSPHTVVTFISLRMGMQNAFPVPNPIKRIRNTSLTGLITEIGIKVGGALHSRSLSELLKLIIEITHLYSFALGALLASVIFQTQSTIFGVMFIVFLEIVAAVYCMFMSTLKKGDSTYVYKQPKKK